MYARSSEGTLLSVVQTYGGGGPLGVRSVSTLWVKPERTRHHLDQCAKTTGRMLGLSDVCYSIRELVANFLYK
jgi:hypothetical protein